MAKEKSPRRSALLSFKFAGTALAGSLAMGLVCALAPAPAQLATLGAFVSVLIGLFLAYLDQEDARELRREEVLGRLAVPLALSPDRELYAQYLAFCKTLTDLAAQTDPILREIAVLKLTSVCGQIEDLAGGTVVFSGTEAWRTVYEKLLQSPDVTEYRSAAGLRCADYWRDQPGRQSMAANFAAAHAGTLIDRVVILPDELWPRGQRLPLDGVLPWIEEQHNHGLRVRLARESDLAAEPDLLADVGIYGERAVGVQELDERCRTVRFVLHFDPQTVRLAKDRWRRLLLFATPFRKLLEEPGGAG